MPKHDQPAKKNKVREATKQTSYNKKQQKKKKNPAEMKQSALKKCK